jgi:predicted PurR-regulated permease PerM
MAEILTPFLAAFILAYILRPVCTWLGRHRVPHPIAALISMVTGLTIPFIGFLTQTFIGIGCYWMGHFF